MEMEIHLKGLAKFKFRKMALTNLSRGGIS